MANYTPSQAQKEIFITQMTQRMAEIARKLSDWVASGPRTLEEMEKMTLQIVKELGNALLGSLISLNVPPYPEEYVPCPCGQKAIYQRMRSIHVDTLLGTITIKRPYYLCPSCHHGYAPLDQKLGVCAGGISSGLEEILALMGAQLPFEEAVKMVAKLSLVEVCPNTCREATERVGKFIAQKEEQEVEEAWDLHSSVLPPLPEKIPERLYVSIDGTTVHTREEGWKEMKLGAFYTTKEVLPKDRPEKMEVRAQDISFYVDFADPETFGRALWLEGYRRGVSEAKEVVAIGDGAHWIWNLVEEHFPGAIQIVDWYHASEYVWKVAHAIYGEGSDLAQKWAKERLDELWDGKVDEVLRHCQEHASAGEAVQQAITYFTNNKSRMRYPEYRARGLQIGSGTVESGCKHVIGARLKGSGMRWGVEGARAVAKVRAKLKSGRWAEAMAQRPPPHRSYQRQAA